MGTGKSLKRAKISSGEEKSRTRRRAPGDNGCLPFTRKNRSVDSCNEWYASNPKWKFSVGCARSISRTFSRKLGSKAIQAKRPGTSKNQQMERTFPFGNSVWEFWSTFQEIPFSRENFRSGDTINLSIYIPSENSEFSG